jgi:hypothetical protein
MMSIPILLSSIKTTTFQEWGQHKMYLFVSWFDLKLNFFVAISQIANQR